MVRYLIALGSSHFLGPEYLARTKKYLRKKNVNVLGESSIYKNNSFATSYNCLFYNSVLAVETSLHPEVFYREMRAIEHNLGRIRTYQNSRRTIDIDLMFAFGLLYKSSSLIIPHTYAWKRNFFVIPAIEALKSASWPKPLQALRIVPFARGYREKSSFNRERHE